MKRMPRTVLLLALAAAIGSVSGVARAGDRACKAGNPGKGRKAAENCPQPEAAWKTMKPYDGSQRDSRDGVQRFGNTEVRIGGRASFGMDYGR